MPKILAGKLMGRPQTVRRCDKDPQSNHRNIPANRLTLVPGFLSRGVCSQFVKRSPTSLVERKTHILNENLYGLIQPTIASPPIKRSCPPVAPQRHRSIFKEIEEKYAQKLKGANITEINADFGSRFLKQITPELNSVDLGRYKGQVHGEIAKMDDILMGKVDLAGNPSGMTRKRQLCPDSDDDKENNVAFKFPYVPESKWVFQTPPNRKLNYHHVKVDPNNGTIQPAVVEKSDDHTVVYEMNKKINVNLTSFTNKQSIDIDKRYMVEVANIPLDACNSSGSPEVPEEHYMEETDDKKFDFFMESDPYELENHFLSLTCRPKKAVSALPRTTASAAFKRKREIFDSMAGCSNFNNSEFDSSFSYLNQAEESFTFHFTPNRCAKSTTGDLFDFSGNRKNSFNFHFSD